MGNKGWIRRRGWWGGVECCRQWWDWVWIRSLCVLSYRFRYKNPFLTLLMFSVFDSISVEKVVRNTGDSSSTRGSRATTPPSPRLLQKQRSILCHHNPLKLQPLHYHPLILTIHIPRHRRHRIHQACLLLLQREKPQEQTRYPPFLLHR